MPAKWQRVKIEIPDDYGPLERQAIATEVLDFIRTRTQTKGLDKRNRSLPGYSDAYKNSLDFKIAGKSKSKVDLTLSGDMLGAMDLLSHRPGEITVGFENGSDENARADGNIRGTYGKSKPVAPARDFLGIAPGDLKKILNKYPVDKRDRARERAEIVMNGNLYPTNPNVQSDEDDE